MSVLWDGKQPEPFAVDAVLEQMEWDAQRAEEKERTRRALAYINAQHKPMHFSGKQLWIAFWKIALWIAGILAVPLALARKCGWL